MNTQLRRAGLALAVVLTVALAACASDEGGEETVTGAATEEPSASEEATVEETETEAETETETETEAAAAEGTVNVLLSEYIVEPDPTSAPAGEITFVADNQGGEEHELVVVRGDDPAALPTDDDGAVDEGEIPEEDFFGEVEEVESGEQDETTLDLEAGSYVLFCNIVEEEDGETESHFAEGMHTTFTVE